MGRRSASRWFLPVSIVLAAGLAFGAFRLAGSTDTEPRALPTAPSPASGSSSSPSPQPAASPAAPHPVSLQTLMQKRFDGRDLKLGRVLSRTGSYTRYFVTYESGGLTISGIMNVPRGAGPFPVLVLSHGYIDPDVYTNGQGLRREQDYLAGRGYVVLHTDYRNHAASDDDPNSDMGLRLGYTEDVVNAILAVRASSFSFVDRERIGVLGRSMGGGVALNVAVVRPDLVDAVVVFASVSSDYVDNFNKWFRRSAERRALAERVSATYGSPEANPGFWRNISPVNFFDRVRAPVLLHHGTADDTCPPAWSERTLAALRAAGKDAELLTYPGEGHAFGSAWPRSMSRTVEFFRSHLRAG